MGLDGGAKWTVLRRTARLSWPVNVGKNGLHRLSEWHKEAKKTGWTEGPHRLALQGREGCFHTWDIGLDLRQSALPVCNSPAGPVCEYHVFPLLCMSLTPNPDLKVPAN